MSWKKSRSSQDNPVCRLADAALYAGHPSMFRPYVEHARASANPHPQESAPLAGSALLRAAEQLTVADLRSLEHGLGDAVVRPAPVDDILAACDPLPSAPSHKCSCEVARSARLGTIQPCLCDPRVLPSKGQHAASCHVKDCLCVSGCLIMNSACCELAHALTHVSVGMVQVRHGSEWCDPPAAAGRLALSRGQESWIHHGNRERDLGRCAAARSAAARRALGCGCGALPSAAERSRRRSTGNLGLHGSRL